MEEMSKAADLVLSQKVKIVDSNQGMIWGTVESTKQGEVHSPWVSRDAAGCSCVAFSMNGGSCKHIVAMLMAFGQEKLIDWVAKVNQ